MARYATFFTSIRPSCDICCGHLIIPTEVSNVILYYNKDQQKQHNCGHISITCKSTLFQINNAFSTVQGYYTKHNDNLRSKVSIGRNIPYNIYNMK